MDPIISAAVTASATRAAVEAVPPETWQEIRKRLARQTVDQALDNVQGTAKSEIDALSDSTKEDLRLQLLQSLNENERDVWSAVMAMQSSERFSAKLVTATWGLVSATAGLVIATIVLVVVTVLHH
jgi:hypothetical protein